MNKTYVASRRCRAGCINAEREMLEKLLAKGRTVVSFITGSKKD